MFKRRFGLVALLIILFVLFLNFYSDRTDTPAESTGWIDRAILTVYHPVLVAWHSVSNTFSDSFAHYIWLVDVSKKNEALTESLRLKQLIILSLQERLRFDERMRAAELKIENLGISGVPAKVLSYDPFSSSQTVWISIGSNQGIAPEMAVITLEGLVGRVIQVLPGKSQVLLLVDSHFAVDVVSENTRVRAMVAGLGAQAKLTRYPLVSHLEYLKLGDAVNAGDLLITSGLSDIYPPNLPVGNVLAPKRGEDGVVESSMILPAVDFTRLEEVIVITGWKRGVQL